MKRLKKFLIFCLLVFSMGTGIKSDAHLAYPDAVYSWSDPVTHWNQWGMPDVHDVILPGGAGVTMAQAACGWYAGYYMLYKAGFIEDTLKYNVKDLVFDATEKGAYYSPWVLDYFKFGDIFPEVKVSGIKPEDLGENSTWYDNRGVVLEGMGQEKAVKLLEALWKRGYYIVVNLENSEVGMHYVFIDYFDENKPGDFRTGDSGFSNKTWLSDYVDHATKSIVFHEAWVVDLSGGNDELLSINRPSMYDDGLKPNGLSKPKKPISSEEFKSIVKELELEGLQQFRLGTYKFQQPVYPARELDNPVERLELQKIKENRVDASKRLGGTFQRVFSVVGFLLVGYSILLLIVFFAYGATFPAVVCFLMFGRGIKELGYGGKRGAISRRSFFLLVGVLFSVGVLLLSGGFEGGLRWLLSFF